MERARRAILDAGGAHECNSFTRFYLALLGQISYDDCPCVPPELVLIPSRLNFSLSCDVGVDANDRRSAFDHVVFTSRCAGSSPDAGLPSFSELTGRCPRGARPAGLPGRTFSWGWTALLKWLDRRLPAAWRKPAVRAAHRWMLEHCENTDGLGAIFPPMVYSIIALRCLDYDLDSPEVQWALDQLSDLQIAEGDRVRVQPCVSPVWDTAIATICAGGRRLAGGPSLRGSARSTGCLPRRCGTAGDWQIRRPGLEPTGWHFQFHNAFYPDLDDSAMVLLGLLRSPLASEPADRRRDPPRSGLAALDAESRRRLGRLRRRHR